MDPKKEPKAKMDIEKKRSAPKSIRADIIGACVIAVIFVFCITLAMVLSPIYSDLGLQAFGSAGTTNPLYAVFYIVMVIVAAVVIILMIKFKLTKVIHIAFLGAIFITIVFLLGPVLMLVMAEEPSWDTVVGYENIQGQHLAPAGKDAAFYNLDTNGTLNLGISGGALIEGGDHLNPDQRIHIMPDGTVVIYDQKVITTVENGNRSKPTPFPFTSATMQDAFVNSQNTYYLTTNAIVNVNGSEHAIITRSLLGADPDLYGLALAGNGKYILYGSNRIALFDNSTMLSTYSGPINFLVCADVTGDQEPEAIIGDPTGIKVFDSSLHMLANIDLDRNVTALSFSFVMGLKKATIVAGFEGGAMLLYDSGSGILEGRIELTGISNGHKDAPTQVCLVEPSDTELKVYVLTPEGLWKISIDFSMDSYIIPGIISAIVAAAAVALLFFFPEWYVIDIVGIIMAIGTIAVIGISLSILPLFILLTALAAYDAIAVYKTKHMITMASSVIEMRLPVLLVIPKNMTYSFRSQKVLKEQLKTEEARAAMFIGLGDIIIPGTLAVSAYTFLAPNTTFLGIGANILVAVFVLIGTLIGFAFLMRFVLTGKPQAGLPLLCTGAIYGYVLGYLLFFQDPTFGFSLPTDLLGF